MQAIQTKYLGPTNTKGARIRAWCERGSITVDYTHGLSVEHEHDRAFKKLLNKFLDEDTRQYGTPLACAWTSHGWIRGGTSSGYVYVADCVSEGVLP